MPGPWVSATENPGFMAGRSWTEGEIIEAVVYDNALSPQGKTLWTLVQEGKLSRSGRFLEARLVIAEDDHLNWWLRHGDGARFKNSFFLHLCKGEKTKCKEVNARKPKEFHTDRLRVLDKDDIRLRKAAWWQQSQVKAEFEKFRSELVGEEDPRGAGRGLDDEFEFEPTDDEEPRVERKAPAAAEGSDDADDRRRRKEETQLKGLERP